MPRGDATILACFCLATLAGLASGQVDVVEETEARGNQFRRTIAVKNYGPVEFRFSYEYQCKVALPEPPVLPLGTGADALEEADAPPEDDELLPAVKEQESPAPSPLRKGLPPQLGAGPCAFRLNSGAWYECDFLSIHVNGKALDNVAARESSVVQQGRRGIVDWVWRTASAETRARFVALPRDDKLYLEVSLCPRQPVHSLELRLQCSPGDWRRTRPKERWLSTRKRHVRQGPRPVTIDTREEPWIFYFEGKVRSFFGTCAVLFLPEEVPKAEVRLGERVLTIARVSPPATRVRLLLWSFPPNYKGPEDAYAYLRANGERLLNDLRTFDFDGSAQAPEHSGRSTSH